MTNHLRLLVTAVLALPLAAAGDDMVDVYDLGARAAAGQLKRGAIYVYYCEPCSQAYEVKYVLDIRVVPTGACLAQVEARTVTLFGGQAKTPGVLGLEPEACQASAEATDAPLGFTYGFRPTRDPLRFVGLGTGTILEAQYGATLRLTKADRRVMDACAALAKKRVERLPRLAAVPATPDDPAGTVGQVRRRFDEVKAGSTQACALRRETADRLARYLKGGVTVLDPYGKRSRPSRVQVRAADAGQARVFVDGAPFDSDTMLFLRTDGRAVFAAALFETEGCTSPSAGATCVDAGALVDEREPGPDCSIDRESDCQ